MAKKTLGNEGIRPYVILMVDTPFPCLPEPEFKVGQVVHVAAASYETKQTPPPDRYTWDTLLADMMVAGLGTSRSRVSDIQKLIDRGLLIGKKGRAGMLVSSPLARELSHVISPMLASAAKTASLKATLLLVERGEMTAHAVIEQAANEAFAIVEEAKRTTLAVTLPGKTGPARRKANRQRQRKRS